MSRLQTNWDLRAALNFMLGGAGAGLAVASGFCSDSNHSVVLSMLLVAAGLGAVWLEIGRKLRVLHVYLNPFTSWMTREAFAAVIFLLLGLSSLYFQLRILLLAAAAAALAFLYCQARILRAAKGIPAWRAPEVVPLLMLTGIAEGAGLGLWFEQRPAILLLLAFAVVARAIAWRRYRAAVRSAALERARATLLRLDTFAVLALAAAAWEFPALAPLAGIAAVASGWLLKLDLVTRAAFKQEFALPRLPVRGAG